MPPSHVTLTLPNPAASGARAIFSPSPIHLDVSEEAEMAKKVARMLAATALPSSVLPVPARRRRAALAMRAAGRRQPAAKASQRVPACRGAPARPRLQAHALALQDARTAAHTVGSHCSSGRGLCQPKSVASRVYAPGGPKRSRPFGGARAPCGRHRAIQ